MPEGGSGARHPDPRSYRMRIPSLLICLALAPIGAAHADDTRFYGGVALGTELDGRYGDLPADLDADHVAKFYFGWRFAEDFSVDATWHELGDARVEPITDFGFDTGTDGWSIGLRYVAPVDFAVQPFARVGYFSFDENGETIGIAGPRDFEADDQGLTVEVGALFPINDRFVLRAGYEWFDFDGDADGSFNAGGEIRF
jgi:hypothetical protein